MLNTNRGLTVIIAVSSFCCCCCALISRETISERLPHLQTLQISFHDSVEHDDIDVTCAEDDQLPKLMNGFTYQWYNSNSEHPITIFKYTDVEHNNVILETLPRGEDTVYVYCVDPVTGNVVTGFQMFQGTYKPLYHLKHTTCPLHDDFWTVLSCRDTLKPPTEVTTCEWRRNQFNGQEVRRIVSGDFIYLGEPDGFPEEEGIYECHCMAKTKKFLMSFTVNKTTEDGGRDMANFQFCIHILKNNTPESPIESVCAPSSLEGQRFPACDQSAYVAVVSVLSVLLVLVVVFSFTFWKRRTQTSTATPSVSGNTSEGNLLT